MSTNSNSTYMVINPHLLTDFKAHNTKKQRTIIIKADTLPGQPHREIHKSVGTQNCCTHYAWV